MTEELARIVVTNITENDDGSATYTFDIDNESSKKITELGLEFILTCAAYGIDINDALVHLRKYGEEKTDEPLALPTDETQA
jgi:hypothetical protein